MSELSSLTHLSNGKPVNAQEKGFVMVLTRFSGGKEVNTLTITHIL